MMGDVRNGENLIPFTFSVGVAMDDGEGSVTALEADEFVGEVWPSEKAEESRNASNN